MRSFISTLVSIGLWGAVVATTLTGCGQNRDEDAKHESRPPLSIEDLETLALMKAAIVKCENPNPEECPSSVGLLISKKNLDGQTGLHKCTAFLVDESTLITNSHCLPEHLREPGRSCERDIIAAFPATENSPAESVGCLTVVAVSLDSDKNEEASEPRAPSPDYSALLLSRPVRRSPLLLSREGLPDLKGLRAFVMEPGSETDLIGILRAKKCYAVQGTTLLPAFMHPFHPIASLSDCEVGPWNSGAPVIGADGRVRAILQHGLQPAPNDAVSIAAAKIPLALATNAACIAPPVRSEHGIKNPNCGVSHGSKDDFLKKKYSEADLRPIEELFHQWKTDLVPVFQFELKKIDLKKSALGEFVVLPDIHCVNDPRSADGANWRDSVKTVKDGWVQIDIRLPAWAYRPIVDGRLRYVMKPVRFSHVNAQIVFDIDELLKKGRTTGNAEFAREDSASAISSSSDMSRIGSFEVRLCPKSIPTN